ncbi:MAG: DUF1109 domain-containing protein [Sphingomonadaceae bacterium]|nr:DUF1109 domain-containing protein [Sphingomonadaceae bacterium]
MGNKLDLDAMTDGLIPVRPLSPAFIHVVAIALTIGGGAFVVATLGFRDAFGASGTDPEFLARSALLIVLAGASLYSAAAMARPQVGSPHKGWRWALGAALVVPVAALIAALVGQTPLADRLHMNNGIECLAYSIGIGLLLGTVLTGWLRRGAPTSPERAGTVTGLAAGSLGALAYSMHCPHNDIVYIGLWYTLAIATTTLLGRLIIPRFIRW